ncbi:Ca2+-transporting ATPase [Dyadobacter soli]|uniref:Ca2+-transporting ATPase n=1 Tax=Dyadobacter soli TaxID=659014 RepID=A0A1G7M1W1_9BACT|nr:cation-transporting P-type ATPase [Dyadobacter soli]SDF55737.1 Ca2+-transporting ATPase [Dyadobacter soli]
MQQLDKRYYTLTVKQALVDLNTDPENGLEDQEASLRLSQYGQNVVEDKRRKSMLSTLLRQFSNPIVWMLLLATGAAFVFRHLVEAVAVLIVILINTTIGFLMERQAIRSMDKLKSLARAKAKVLRNGERRTLDSADLVPGDLLLIQAGDLVTADARLISVNNLSLKESALSGESTQVAKNTAPLSDGIPVADRSNTVFKGTEVIKGKGVGVIFSTGRQTELGKITALAQGASKEATPLNKKLRELSVRLIWLTTALTVLIFISGMIRGESLLLMIETAIALAIACIPEGLPVISTLSLARGMIGLLKKNVLVKTLESVQTLGETQVIFTDKTGTLTENEMRVRVVALDGFIEDFSDEISHNKQLKYHPAFHLFSKAAVLCNDADLQDRINGEPKAVGDPEEVALLRLSGDLSDDIEQIRTQNPRMAEVPFDSQIKMMGTLHSCENGYLTCVKGAWEEVSGRCSKIFREGQPQHFDNKTEWNRKVEELARSGLRVLSFAFRISEDIPQQAMLLDDLVFIGIAGFMDPARPDIKESILCCQQAGIKVVMVTGDHPGTAVAIATAIGLSDGEPSSHIHGKEILEKHLSAQTVDRLLQASVFSRVDPAQKLGLVSLYQQQGLVVGMTGDGVNDAPALRKADIGIAMGVRGTGAAKEAADLIINDDAFTSILAAIQYGRVIFDNIQTFVIYLLSCNLSEILIVALASFLELPMPLLPLQILFLNMITDVFPALAIGMSRGEPELVMNRPPRKPSEAIVSKANWISIVAYAGCLTAGVLGAEFYVFSTAGGESKLVNNVTFCTLILAQLWNVFNMAQRKTPFFANQITANKYVWLAIFFCLGALMITYQIPALPSALSLVSLGHGLFGIVLVFSLIPVVLVQLLKRGFGIIG